MNIQFYLNLAHKNAIYFILIETKTFATKIITKPYIITMSMYIQFFFEINTHIRIKNTKLRDRDETMKNINLKIKNHIKLNLYFIRI